MNLDSITANMALMGYVVHLASVYKQVNGKLM